MQPDLCHFNSHFSAIQFITLKVVYAACERVLNVKTGWADSSRRMCHFSEDAALKNSQYYKKDYLFSRSKHQYLYFDYHTNGWGTDGRIAAILRPWIRSAENRGGGRRYEN